MNTDTSYSVDEIFNLAVKRLTMEAPGYRVRNAASDDITRVIEINMVSLPEHYPRRFFEELYEEYGKAFYVAEAPNGEVVGYIMTRVEWKPGFFHRFIARSGHVVSIAVLKEHRGRSLGYALMAYAMKSMYYDYKCNETYLEVRVSNNPAISLYEKLGYRKVKVEKNYYLDGEDAYVMARELP
ncbi:ribosomal protein S18-alanine N-acetyltransferase [Desulfurococcus amylolyticus]|uniref:Ribosomal-protein-alanine acetyltransferase n=1 Tax=Desulfurococcus amylolyticus DSM 16532 TaxID=768672 RepID=I3XQV7_DESAM|nr:ribosomal protein S18-alanine N-acetyltransferase [Desulfurococcus amylolyticus]AFL66331.1 ribosomal-protein-alanine acetyltransferase [Desulfurococcus amylolyticus DSM 16532]